MEWVVLLAEVVLLVLDLLTTELLSEGGLMGLGINAIVGVILFPDEPRCFPTDPHQRPHRTCLHHRRRGWVVDHLDTLPATDSLLRSLVAVFAQGFPRRPLRQPAR